MAEVNARIQVMSLLQCQTNVTTARLCIHSQADITEPSESILHMTCFIIINQLVLWDPPVNYYSIAPLILALLDYVARYKFMYVCMYVSAGGKDQLSMQGFQYRCTSCLELSVFIY